jgi:glutaredoxin
MLKLISKINCPRCEEIKKYLEGRKIDFEVEMAEDRGYGYWREKIQQITGKLGFPILEYGVVEPGSVVRYVNGSSEEIIGEVNKWYPTIQPDRSEEKECQEIHFDWAICECGYKGKKYE